MPPNYIVYTIRPRLAGLLLAPAQVSGGALPNVFSEEPFLVKNRGAKAVLEEPLLLQSTLEGALPNEA